jgi:hypothetical protein
MERFSGDTGQHKEAYKAMVEWEVEKRGQALDNEMLL